MKNSLLQLNQAQVGEVVLRPTAPPGPFTSQVNVGASVSYSRNDTDARHWLVEMGIEFKSGEEGKNTAYTGSIQVRGLFTMNGDMAEESVLKFIAVTCPSILYATAREMIATLTGRSFNGVFLLPVMSFSDHDIKFDNPTQKRSPPQKILAV